MFDYLIVGAGLFGATLAHILSTNGKRVLVVERKLNVGGTVYTEQCSNITIHKYGAHIFRTDDADIWHFFTKFSEFVPFINTPIAIHNGISYNLPFNMNTFSKLWGISTPEEAKRIIAEQTANYSDKVPENLEEYALATVGKDIYSCFIKEYTEKQWNKRCSELPASTMGRIPIRFTYNNNYYNARYQGVPVNGYTFIINKMLSGSVVLMGIDGKKFVENNKSIATRIIYTGRIDEFFDYKYGSLEYRSLKFEEKVFETDNVQGVAVVNWSDNSVPYTRSIEHKHFACDKSDITIVSYEYPVICDNKNDAYYPINTKTNNALYERYVAENYTDIIFAGRLGEYKYYDMADTLRQAIKLADKLLIKGGQS